MKKMRKRYIYLSQKAADGIIDIAKGFRIALKTNLIFFTLPIINKEVFIDSKTS